MSALEINDIELCQTTAGYDPNTIGELRVRTTFNPSANGDVEVIKQRTAELISLCDHLEPKDARLVALAQTVYKEADMWAVKAATA